MTGMATMPGSNCAVEQIPALSQALMSDDPQARHVLSFCFEILKFPKILQKFVFFVQENL